MEVREVTAGNAQVYLNLCQAYEAEFSALTGKLPDQDGLFALDTVLGGEVKGFLLVAHGGPVGFAAIRISAHDGCEVCEFYIVPSMRKKCLGKEFAHRLFALYPGKWQVKQLEGARYATCFWLRVIDDFTGSSFEQDVCDDAYWGRVARQCFVSPLPDERD